MDRELLSKQIDTFTSLNRFAAKGQILLFGSTMLSRFPVYELKQDFAFDETIYNRGIRGLTLKDALDILKPCVFDLFPGKLFLDFGDAENLEEEAGMNDFLETYQKLIRLVHSELPDCQIYLLSVVPERKNDSRINQELWKLSIDMDCEFINLTPYLTERKNSLEVLPKRDRADDLQMQTYAMLFQKLRIHFYNKPITFGEMFRLINP